MEKFNMKNENKNIDNNKSKTLVGYYCRTASEKLGNNV